MSPERASFRDELDIDTLALTVKVDSSRNELTAFVGPLRTTGTPAPDEPHDGPAPTAPLDFSWPVDGWLRGFRVQLIDSSGAQLPRALLHHLVVVNYGRRQLIYPIMERLIAASSETDDLVLPSAIGIPIPKGQRLGLYVALNSQAGRVAKVFVRLTVLWTPDDHTQDPTSILPGIIDVNNVIGETPAYDLPRGRSARTFEFTSPISGRIAGAGGHLHDYGESLQLQEVRSSEVLVTLEARKTREGKLKSVQRKIFLRSKSAPMLQAGVRYRFTSVYDNPTAGAIESGAMAHMVVAVVPNDLASWPRVDPQHADYQKDLKSLHQSVHMHGDLNQRYRPDAGNITRPRESSATDPAANPAANAAVVPSQPESNRSARPDVRNR